MIHKLLRSKNGEGHLDVVIGVVALAMFIVVALNIFTFVSLKTTLDRIADDLIEIATYTGAFGEDFELKADQLREKHFDFDVEVYAAEYFNAEEKKVQMGEDMSVVIKVNASVSGIDIALPIDLSVSRIGRSEQYWRVAGGTYVDPEIDYSGKSLFVLDADKKEFHYPSCDLASIPEEHRKELYSTADELLFVGYTACVGCQPHDCYTYVVTHFNVHGHWGYCPDCSKQDSIEPHLWTYSDEMEIYYCEYCEAIEDKDGLYCCTNGARLNESAHQMGCTCHWTSPSLVVNNLSTSENSPTMLSPGIFRITGMTKDLEGTVKKITVNGQKATLFADGEWYFDLNFTTDMDPLIKIVAVDDSDMQTVLDCYVTPYVIEVKITADNKTEILNALGIDDSTPGYTLTIPEYYTVNEAKFKIVGIGDRAFFQDSAIGAVKIVGSNRSYFEIGLEAFMCSSISSLDIEAKSISSLGSNAFSECSSLTEAKIPSANLTGRNVFDGSAIEIVTLSETLSALETGMFQNCSRLRSVELKNVTSINAYAFSGTGLEYIDLRNITYIGDYAFAYSKIINVAIPKLTEGWGTYSFSNCASLTSVQIASGNELIPEGAFRDCSQLMKITCDDSTIREIGFYAFYNCKNLNDTWIFREPLRIIGDYAFYECSGIESFVFCPGIEYIGEYAFYSTTTIQTTLSGNTESVPAEYDWAGSNRTLT